MGFDLAALEAAAAAEETAASAVRLTDDEKRAASAVERIQKAKEERAAAERQRRAVDCVVQEGLAKAKARGAYLVRALDLYAFFPPEVDAPPAGELPGGGVIVIRSPEGAKFDATTADLEHKVRPMADALTDLLCSSVVHPDLDDKTEAGRVAGITFRAFCEKYKGAATMAGDEVLKLGGMRARATKRGSA